MGIRVIGIRETQRNLTSIDAKLEFLIPTIVSRFAQRIAQVARELYPKGSIDTGALLASIGNHLLESSTRLYIEEVYAGDPNFIRGEGAFTISRKTGRPVSRVSTEEYAPYAHLPSSDQLIMEQVIKSAYDWGLKNVKRYVAQEVKRIVGGL